MSSFVRHPGAAFCSSLGSDEVTILNYGVDDDGASHGWHLGTPHMRIAGQTGAGKAAVVRSVILSAVASGISVFISDPRGVESASFRGFPGCRVASSTTDGQQPIRQTHELLRERYAAVSEAVGRDEQAPTFDPVLLVVHVTAPDYPGSDLVSELLNTGRSVRIHVLMATEDPRTVLLGTARDNLQHQVSCGPLSHESASAMWEGVDLPNYPGAGAVSVEGAPARGVRFYWAPELDSADADDRSLIEEFRELAARHFPDSETSVTAGSGIPTN